LLFICRTDLSEIPTDKTRKRNPETVRYYQLEINLSKIAISKEMRQDTKKNRKSECVDRFFVVESMESPSQHFIR